VRSSTQTCHDTVTEGSHATGLASCVRALFRNKEEERKRLSRAQGLNCAMAGDGREAKRDRGGRSLGGENTLRALRT
jgi:hypothetical protein